MPVVQKHSIVKTTGTSNNFYASCLKTLHCCRITESWGGQTTNYYPSKREYWKSVNSRFLIGLKLRKKKKVKKETLIFNC